MKVESITFLSDLKDVKRINDRLFKTLYLQRILAH
jgi:hypothetical protein